MKKIYIMEHLGCANCAAKMEAKFNAHPQVAEATITFSTRQLRLDAENPDSLIPELQELARTVEGGIVIVPRESVKSDDEVHTHSCGCGENHHSHQCGCGHSHKTAPETSGNQRKTRWKGPAFQGKCWKA